MVKYISGNFVKTTNLPYNIPLIVRYDEYDILSDDDIMQLMDIDGNSYVFKRSEIKFTSDGYGN